MDTSLKWLPMFRLKFPSLLFYYLNYYLNIATSNNFLSTLPVTITFLRVRSSLT